MDRFLSEQCINFMKFVDDCAIYCIASRGMHYEPLPTPVGYTKYFSDDYGEAVLHYHGAHENRYRERIRKLHNKEVLTEAGVQDYMSLGITECFQRQITMEGILMFCSLYIDTAFFCCRYGKSHLINDSLVCSVSLAFEEYVRALFCEVHPSLAPRIWNDIKQMGIELVEREKAIALSLAMFNIPEE